MAEKKTMASESFCQQSGQVVYTDLVGVHPVNLGRSNARQTQGTLSAPSGHSVETTVCGVHLDRGGLQTLSEAVEVGGW